MIIEKFFLVLNWICLALFCAGCAGGLESRSFLTEMENQDDDFFLAGRDFPTVSGDTGEAYRSRRKIAMRTPASKRERSFQRENLSIHNELLSKEGKLTSYQQKLYLQARPYLSSPSEKIYFLNLSDAEKREYLNIRSMESHRFLKKEGGHKLVSLRPLYSGPLTLGMSKDDVIQMWGRPARVDVAGNPFHQNERWIFYGNSGVGYIYFESGRVQGWNLRN